MDQPLTGTFDEITKAFGKHMSGTTPRFEALEDALYRQLALNEILISVIDVLSETQKLDLAAKISALDPSQYPEETWKPYEQTRSLVLQRLDSAQQTD